MELRHASDASFANDVLDSGVPVLVEFWAEWCGPCRGIAPILEELAEAYAGRLLVAKFDIDGNPETPRRYGVRGIPTLMLFRDGAPVGTKVGAWPKQDLVLFVDGCL